MAHPAPPELVLDSLGGFLLESGLMGVLMYGVVCVCVNVRGCVCVLMYGVVCVLMYGVECVYVCGILLCNCMYTHIVGMYMCIW